VPFPWDKLPKNPLFFDIETGGKSAERSSIYSISWSGKQGIQSNYALPVPGTFVSPWVEKNVLGPIQKEVASKNLKYQTEQELIKNFIGTLQERGKEKNPVLAGWNIGYNIREQGQSGFDLSFLLQRSKIYGQNYQMAQAISKFKIRDIGREFATASAIKLYSARKQLSNADFANLVEPNLWKQMVPYARQAYWMSTAKNPMGVSSIAEKLQDYKIHGWSMDLAHRTLLPGGQYQAHLSGSDIAAMGQIVSQGMGLDDIEYTRRWGKEAARGRIGRLAEKGMGLDWGNLGKKYGKYFENTEWEALKRTVGKDIVSNEERLIGKAGKIGTSEILNWVKNNRGKTGLLAGGLGIAALYYFKPLQYINSQTFKGTQSNYNSIQGMREEGEGRRIRRSMTDFGSGYRGLKERQEKTEEEFAWFKQTLEEYGVKVGTGHNRILIPKSVITRKELEKELGYKKVLAAIPEGGQTSIFSYRSPEELYHLHSFGKWWSMHKDEEISSTMLQYQKGNEGNLLSNFKKGLPHLLTEGVPGLFYYLRGKFSDEKDSMKSRLMKELPSEYFKALNNRFSGYGFAYNTIPGMREEGEGRRLRHQMTEFGSAVKQLTKSKDITENLFIKVSEGLRGKVGKVLSAAKPVPQGRVVEAKKILGELQEIYNQPLNVLKEKLNVLNENSCVNMPGFDTKTAVMNAVPRWESKNKLTETTDNSFRLTRKWERKAELKIGIFITEDKNKISNVMDIFALGGSPNLKKGEKWTGLEDFLNQKEKLAKSKNNLKVLKDIEGVRVKRRQLEEIGYEEFTKFGLFHELTETVEMERNFKDWRINKKIVAKSTEAEESIQEIKDLEEREMRKTGVRSKKTLERVKKALNFAIANPPKEEDLIQSVSMGTHQTDSVVFGDVTTLSFLSPKMTEIIKTVRLRELKSSGISTAILTNENIAAWWMSGKRNLNIIKGMIAKYKGIETDFKSPWQGGIISDLIAKLMLSENKAARLLQPVIKLGYSSKLEKALVDMGGRQGYVTGLLGKGYVKNEAGEAIGQVYNVLGKRGEKSALKVIGDIAPTVATANEAFMSPHVIFPLRNELERFGELAKEAKGSGAWWARREATMTNLAREEFGELVPKVYGQESNQILFEYVSGKGLNKILEEVKDKGILNKIHDNVTSFTRKNFESSKVINFDVNTTNILVDMSGDQIKFKYIDWALALERKELISPKAFSKRNIDITMDNFFATGRMRERMAGGSENRAAELLAKAQKDLDRTGETTIASIENNKSIGFAPPPKKPMPPDLAAKMKKNQMANLQNQTQADNSLRAREGGRGHMKYRANSKGGY